MPRLLNNARELRESLKRRDSDESVYSMTIGTPESDKSSCSNRSGDDDGDDKNAKYVRADFEGETLTSQQLDLFNDAWQDFVDSIATRCANSDNDLRQEVILLAKPNTLRPVPQSLENFEKLMPIAYLSKEAVKKKKYLEVKLVGAYDGTFEGSVTVNPAEYYPTIEEEESSHVERLERTVYEQVNSLNYYCNGVNKLLAQDPVPWRLVFEQILVATDILFDHNIHMVFGLHSPVERVGQLLARIGEVWQKVLARDGNDYEFEKLEGGDWRNDITKFLASCQHDLNSGLYVDHINPFKDTVFPFRESEKNAESEAKEKARKEKEEAEEAARLKEEEEKKKAAAAKENKAPRRVFGSWGAKRSKPEPAPSPDIAEATVDESKRARHESS